MAGSKSKGGKGSGSSNDQRGGIAKAQEAARKGGQDTASGTPDTKAEKGGASGHSGGSKSGGKR